MALSRADGDGQVAALKAHALPSEEEPTAEQMELLNDMRISLRQLKRGDEIPARAALREIWLELEAEDDDSNSYAYVAAYM